MKLEGRELVRTASCGGADERENIFAKKKSPRFFVSSAGWPPAYSGSTTAAPWCKPSETRVARPGRSTCAGVPSTLELWPSAGELKPLPHVKSRPCVSTTPDTSSPAKICWEKG